MSATAASLRWSSTADCPRKAILAATTEPDRDWTEKEARIMFRGRSIGADYATWLEQHHGETNVLREVKVDWAFGVGHMDIFLVPTATAIEVLSSRSATEEMVQRKLLQLAGYMEAYEPAENGCLVVLDPSDFSEDRWPLVKQSDTYRGLLVELNERLYLLHRWRETGVLPDRVCRKPSDAIGHFCRHATTCFDGWVAPEPVSVVDDPDALRLATELSFAKSTERACRSQLAEAEAERRAIEADLAELDGVAGIEGDIRIGSYVVKRTHVRRRPTLNMKKALAAGVVNEELLAPYMKPGADYWTTTIERRDGDAGPVDFGDEAPWTDEDLVA